MKLNCKARDLEISEPLSELKDLNLIDANDGTGAGQEFKIILLKSKATLHITGKDS